MIRLASNPAGTPRRDDLRHARRRKSFAKAEGWRKSIPTRQGSPFSLRDRPTHRHASALLLLLLSLASTANAVTFTENFAASPTANGWRIFGDTNLFHWDRAGEKLHVTWDSSRTNSYFHRPLGTILTPDDDFSLGFDLTLEDYAIGTTPGKLGTFELAIGLLNLEQAARTNFFRGAGVNSSYGPRDLVEFNFFPAWESFLPTIAQVAIATNNQWLFNHDNLRDLTPGETFHIALSYAATSRTLTTVLTNAGLQFGTTQTIVIPTNFDFRVSTLSVSSYSDAIQPPPPGSILAHGAVDNFLLITPPPPVENLRGGFAGGHWRIQFTSHGKWRYTLERTTDFQTWLDVTSPTSGNGDQLTLEDSNPPPGSAAYRVRAQRP